MTFVQRENHLTRNIFLGMFIIIILIIAISIYFTPIIIEKNIQLKEWRENASCSELNEYLIKNVDDYNLRNYQMIEKVKEIKCK